MPRFEAGRDSDGGDLEGVDRHHYEKQIGPSSPFDRTHAFRLATARAKDRARHKLIRAIRKKEREARGNSLTGLGDFSQAARREVYAQRTVDGVKGATDDAIKL